jgi:hypothetical protein
MIPPAPQLVRQVLQQRLSSLTQLRQQANATYQQIESDLDANLSRYNSVANGADAVATVAQVFAGLVGIVRQGTAALKLTGPALEAANRALANQGLHVALDPLVNPILSFTAGGVNAQWGTAWAIGKLSLQDFVNMQSPSWWAGVVGNRQDGKSWGQAVTTSPEEQLQATKDQIEAQQKHILQGIDAHITETRALLAALDSKGLAGFYSQAQ